MKPVTTDDSFKFSYKGEVDEKKRDVKEKNQVLGACLCADDKK